MSNRTQLFNYRVLWLLAIGAGVVLLAVDSIQLSGLTGGYPRTLIAITLVLLAAIIYREARTTKRPSDYDAELASLGEGPRVIRARVFGFVAAWLAYPILLSYAGFIVSTSLSIGLCLWLVGVKRWLTIILLPIVFSVILSVLITYALYIPTPTGPIDQGLTQLIYAIQGS